MTAQVLNQDYRIPLNIMSNSTLGSKDYNLPIRPRQLPSEVKTPKSIQYALVKY